MQNDRTLGSAADRLSRRPSTVADHDFLETLFAQSRPEFALLPQPVRTQVTRMQFESQLNQYRTGAPDAVDWILQFDHGDRLEPVGRCYLRQGVAEHRLLDLAIGAQWRRQGLAGSVLSQVCADAARARVPLRLTVWHANHDALRLYRRHGFVADDGDGAQVAGYLRLRWPAR